MCRWLWDPLSIPYFQFIQDIVLSPSTFHHHQIFTPQSSRPKHLRNNWRFLKMLPKLERLLQIKVPQLLLAIPATEETSPIMAYNQIHTWSTTWSYPICLNLSFPCVPTYQEHMLDIIKRPHHSILAFNPRTWSLNMFPWWLPWFIDGHQKWLTILA